MLPVCRLAEDETTLSSLSPAAACEIRDGFKILLLTSRTLNDLQWPSMTFSDPVPSDGNRPAKAWLTGGCCMIAAQPELKAEGGPGPRNTSDLGSNF